MAAWATTILYPEANVTIARCVVDNEHPDNDRFHADCEKWIGKEIKRFKSDKYVDCWDVWEKKKFLSGKTGAPCTIEMKKAVRWKYEQEFDPDFQVLGFSEEEQNRAERFRVNNPEVKTILPLIERGYTKPACQRVIVNVGIRLPRMYELGFKNNNCMGCVRASSPTYWARVRLNFPAYFTSMCELSRRLNSKLITLAGERIYLDELPEDVDYSAVDLDEEIECGILCSGEGQ